ncbi:MAG: PD40 domain-containing protein [Bacteroidales bacterium]|nr:PD40 domain-containing protein [Bacteroidales bacterium]
MKRIYLMLVALIAVSASAENAMWLRYPSISPDGKNVAFSYKGDIYLVDSEGGEAVQLTSNTAYDYSPVWSPDGKTVAFASDRFGNFDIFTVSVEGGVPVRITTHSAKETPWTFTPDGKNILFTAHIQDPASSALFPKSTMTELYSVSVKGGRPVQVLGTPAEEVEFISKDGSFLYQDCKGGENIWRKHHTSSITRDIWIYDGSKHTKLTSFEGEDRSPRVSKDGKTVYYLSERGGSFNVYSFPVDNPQDIRTVTKHKTHPVRFLTVSDNDDLCYGYDGDIYVKKGSAAARKIQVTVKSDKNDDNLAELSVSGGGDNDISSDGKQIAFISRGEVFVASTEYSTVKKITDTPEAEADVVFSPDGKTIAYASEREGIWNIYTAEIVRKEDISFPYATLIEEKPLFKNNKVDRRAPVYSPDGKELAYIEDRDRLMIMNLETGKTRQITDGSQCFSTTGAFNYSWSPDGKWILMSYCARNHYPYDDIGIVSTKGGEPMINLTDSGYTDSAPQWVLGGNAILFASERYGMRNHASWGTLEDVMIVFLNRKSYDEFKMTKEERELEKEIAALAEDKKDDKKDKDAKKEDKVEDIVVELDGIDERIIRLTPVSSNLGSAALSKDGTTLYYQASYESGMNLWKYDLEKGTPTKIGAASGRMKWDEKQGTLYVLGSRFSKMKEGGKSLESISVRGEMVMDLAAEREYMFNHVYRQEKERFYNEKMHGVDWEMLTAAYRKFLPHINNNYDFAELLSEYLGELNVSHTGSGYRAPTSRESASTANLGLFYDLGWQEDGLKVAEIVKGGPFDKASSKLSAGDVITSINGVEIKKGMDFYPLLDRKAGERTLIGIRKASGEKAEMVVLPISQSSFMTLLYKRWVKQNAEKVQQLSGGRLGYVHIEGMDDESFRTVYSDILGRYNHCDGIVIDTRFNGGGRLHEDIEVLFSGEKYLTQEIRGKDACDMPSRRYNKASIMIIGEANYSNAHGTPWVYKHKDMGLLVGKPVPGTMTSVTWETLQDATLYFGIPVVGYRKADGTYLENDQLNPDIDVENTKELVVTGRDEQLEAAVKALLQQIDSEK